MSIGSGPQRRRWGKGVRLDSFLRDAFIKDGDGPENINSKLFVVRLWIIGLLAIFVFSLLRHAVPSFRDEETVLGMIAADAMAAYAFGLTCFCLVYLYCWGMTRFLKVFFILNAFCWLTAVCVADSTGTWHFLYLLVFDYCLIMYSDEDAVLLHRLSVFLRALFVVYVALHVLDLGDLGPSIHTDTFGWSYNPFAQFLCGVFPILINFSMFQTYILSARTEARRVAASVELASQIAEKLVDFDLEGAEALLVKADESPMRLPLSELLRNLRTYQTFLPHALFHSETADDARRDPPNELMARVMSRKSMSLERASSAARRLREPGYSLLAFTADIEAAFPELELYKVRAEGLLDSQEASKMNSNGSSARKDVVCSSGLTGWEEYQRTMGAMYSIYCIVRMDLDGKDVFSFGVDSQWRPRSAPAGATAEQRRRFRDTMAWDKILQLFVRANLLSVDDGLISVNSDRMMAFLVLTAVHDVMKNTLLLPQVQHSHAPYQGIDAGARISDHNVALAYIMEGFPSLLPSFHDLTPGQRAPVLFAQGKMGFNNGWFVQGEAPPGALFSTFKRVIMQGRASESDVSFYFAHWLTDLAGSEPYGSRPWPGSEKFSVRFPMKVLEASLDSFAFVDRLATKSEVEVMEDYLHDRWATLGPPMLSEALVEGCQLAAMRLALMAQGFETQIVAALQELPSSERDVIATEMARTGRQQQFAEAPAYVRSNPGGPALLVYYAPALIQKAGVEQAKDALLILAAVYRAARELFPIRAGSRALQSTAIVRIDALKVMSPQEIFAAEFWILRQTFDTEAEAVCDREAVMGMIRSNGSEEEDAAVGVVRILLRSQESEAKPSRTVTTGLRSAKMLENGARRAILL